MPDDLDRLAAGTLNAGGHGGPTALVDLLFQHLEGFTGIVAETGRIGIHDIVFEQHQITPPLGEIGAPPITPQGKTRNALHGKALVQKMAELPGFFDP